MNKQLRIGVFLCDCGGEIPSILKVEELLGSVSSLDDIVLVKRIPYSCSPDGEATIRDGIRNASLSRIVLLGCSPRIVEKKFKKVLEETGLNPSLLEIVNLRDHCVRVHQIEPDIANAKAWDLIRMGIARARYLSPLDPIKVTIRPEVAVIGGGIAGMTSALSLADHGIRVKLVEKERSLGGSLRKLNKLLPPIEEGAEIARNLAKQIRKSENIELLIRAEPTAVSGSYGNYEIELKVGKNKSAKIECGAVILATGAQEYKPEGEYGYGKNDKVTTQDELGQKIEDDFAIEDLDNIVMIQCVGARNDDRPYCGRICCLTAVHNAINLKEKKPSLNVTILYRDIPIEPGPDRIMLHRAHELGITFTRFASQDSINVTKSAVTGRSFNGSAIKLPYDLVVLSSPPIPYESSQSLAGIFHIPVDQFGFLPDAVPNLKPHQCVEPCIHVVGSAHWPCSLSEAMYQAYGRSARIASMLQKAEVSSTHANAIVDASICRGCGTCIEWCPFHVPVLKNGPGDNPISFIDPFLCKGCGTCVVHCPSGAATIGNLEDKTYYSVIEAALSDRDLSKSKIITFLCDWSGYAVYDLAGARRRNLPGEVIPIRIPCAGRISTGMILYAFALGADGVLVCACEEGDCHYQNGNTNCATVSLDTQNLLSLLGIEKSRYRMIYINPVDVKDFCEILEDFVEIANQSEPSVPTPIYAETKS